MIASRELASHARKMDWEINDVLARTLVIFGQHKEALRVAKQANEIGKIEERRGRKERI